MAGQQTGRASGCLAMMPVVPPDRASSDATGSLMPEPASGMAWRTPSEHKVLDGWSRETPDRSAPTASKS